MLFSATALFGVVTLPVEFDASKRAKAQLWIRGFFTGMNEGISKVLDSAALHLRSWRCTTISTILYYALLLIGRSNRDY